MTSDVSDFVVLKGGLAVPVAPVLLLLGLEARGIRVARDGDQLTVCPGQELTGQECQQIRQWKLHLLTLVDYRPPEVQ